MFGHPDPNVGDCPALITPDLLSGGENVVRVPVVLDAGELELLEAGGTLWLSTWGGLPAWMLEVAPPPPPEPLPVDLAAVAEADPDPKALRP